MGFGDILKSNLHRLSNATLSSSSGEPFWMILRDIAAQEILAVAPSKVDSDIAVEVFYQILKENEDKLPEHYRVKLKSNKQERFRVINRNVWTSNAFHKDGLATQNGIKAFKELNPSRKGRKIIYQGVK